MKEVTVNLFRDNSYLWLGAKAVDEAGFKEGTPYYQTWDNGTLTCTLAEPMPGEFSSRSRTIKRKVNQHKHGACIRAEGTPVIDTFNGFKSVKATISPGRIEVVGHERVKAIENLPSPGAVANALAGR